MAKALCAIPKNAEKIKKYLVENNLLSKEFRIEKDNDFVYFPIKETEVPYLKDFKIIDRTFRKIKAKVNSYKDFIKIHDEIKDKLPSSYDIIGNIAIIKLKDDALKYDNIIGDALLKSNKSIKTVCSTTSVGGEYRTRDIKIIAGKKTTETIHREYGLSFTLDVKNTYYSPRLANERMRITKLVKPNEIVVDMFAGVGPFSIMIAKYAKPKVVIAVDKNNYATDYAHKNILRNKVLDKVEIICTDSKYIKKFIDMKADRIIMNLPFSSYNFFKNALEIAANKVNIHYYEIIDENKIEKRIESLKIITRLNSYKLDNSRYIKIKTYSPREFYIGIDITATKMPT